MAGTSRFHDKLHRFNHHSLPTPGYIDSATDPIASRESPFHGDFILDGSLSASDNCTVTNATIQRDLTVVNTTLLSGDIYTDWEQGGVITTNAAGSNTKNGAFSLTLNYNNGVYINGAYGADAKLVVGVPGALFDQGTISVTNLNAKDAQLTNIVATNASLTSLNVKNTVGIGTENPQHTLHVVGDVIIYGTLTANGNSYFQNTLFTTTSSLSIVNTGTGAGLTVSQEGNQPIVAFYDHESSISLWADGDASRPGWVGVKTHTPNVEFTVNGSVSASGIVYGSDSSSTQWTSVYNSTTANSGNWDTSFTTTNNNSASWVTSYTTTTANSARWEDAYTATSNNSASWVSNYSTTSTNSARWENAYTATSNNSASWDSNYSTTSTNSASWVDNYVTTSANSASWIAAYSSVNVNSASWDAAYSTTNTNSASWDASYSTTNTNSASWVANYTTSNAKSASWDAVYAAVASSSASWNAGGGSAGDTYVVVSTNSANWNDSYTTANTVYATTSSFSGQWSASYNAVHANSGTWNTTAQTLTGINLNYLTDVSIVTNTLADGQVLTYDIGTGQWENSSLVLSGVVQGSSTWESTHTTVAANSSVWNTNSLSGSIDVSITSPTNNALLQYDVAQGKWVDGDTLITSGTLTAGSIDLTTAEVSTFETELSASGDFLLLRINGVVRKLRLWD
jgi:hypothetical protein